MKLQSGSIRLFRFAGIDVFLHYTWFLIALIEINARVGSYSNVLWNVLEYLALFLIVLLHEFGHALACRQVGGIAERIVLWPLGGVAYVNPPPRPGAMLWSLAAGPLVNVLLLPILVPLAIFSASVWAKTFPDLNNFIFMVAAIDVVLLVFNMLPVYPLDGGQILRSLLWFVVGRARSLTIAASIGIVGVVAFAAFAFYERSVWDFVLAIFIFMNCWGGLKQARVLARLAKLPRHQGFACPWCKSAPPIGFFWVCNRCGKPFDTFATHAVCPNCSTQFSSTRCLDCGQRNPMSQWEVAGTTIGGGELGVAAR